MQSQNFRLRLVSCEPLNTGVKLFTFELMDNHELVYSPGQFLSIQLVMEDGKMIKRSYSIANLTNKLNLVEFAITLVPNGAATKYLCKLKHGDVVNATGPRGKFTFREDIPGRHIMIGTGTGVVPYRSMLCQVENFLQQNPLNSCIILQGVKSRDSILFKEDFMKLCVYDNFHFTACLSRETSYRHLEEPYEILGHVQDMFESIELNPDTDTVYLCGNPYMIDDVKSILHKTDFTQERIVTEQYFAKKTEP